MSILSKCAMISIIELDQLITPLHRNVWIQSVVVEIQKKNWFMLWSIQPLIRTQRLTKDLQTKYISANTFFPNHFIIVFVLTRLQFGPTGISCPRISLDFLVFSDYGKTKKTMFWHCCFLQDTSTTSSTNSTYTYFYFN